MLVLPDTAVVIIYDESVVIGDDQFFHRQIGYLVDGRRNTGWSQCIQILDLIGKQLCFFHNRLLFALIKQLLAELGTINIQKQQNKGGDDNKAKCKTQMCTAVLSEFSPLIS